MLVSPSYDERILKATYEFMIVDEDKVTVDRKSTRLNSSHTVISYAVFCLKKKQNYRRYKKSKQRKRDGDKQDVVTRR